MNIYKLVDINEVTGETMPVDDMDSEDDCISLDSGLETSGQALESESIYENAAVLKSANLVKSVTPTLEKYQFGLNEDFEHFTVADSDVGDGEDRGDVTGGDRGVTWGVRSTHSPPQPAIRTGSPFDRSTNPTEDKIAKEIREMKEREEELKAIRERTVTPSPVPAPAPVPGASGGTEVTEAVRKQSNSDKFNPSNYQPQILHPDKKATSSLGSNGRPRIMEEFLSSGGKVTPFTISSPPQPSPVVQLRKPQVHKTVPKVSPPAPSGQRQASGLLVSVQDKIQAEVKESLAREEELRRRRRSTIEIREEQDRVEEQEEQEQEVVEQEDIVQIEQDIQVPTDHPSLMHIRGKSALISVWENRIQSAERNA